jgi:hypothetical protein
MHQIKMIMAAAVLGFAGLIGMEAPATAASASIIPMPLQAQIPAQGDLLQQVHWRGEFCYHNPYHWRCRRYGHHNYCRNWRWRCADRWGWHTRRYYRCLRRHGC